MSSGQRARDLAIMLVVLAAIATVALSAVSCGGEAQPAQTAGDAGKYPPGTSEEMLEQTTGSGDLALEGDTEKAVEKEKDEEESSADLPGASVELAGARFTVVGATRQDSNADVLTAGQREVPGDYYEIELEVQDIGSDLVDLSEYSFRLWSTGIAADQYEEYYGNHGALGEYVSENMISASLLDYATLQPAVYKLKIGETVDGVFLFYDLNPKKTARNEGVTKEGTNLVIHKVRGDGAGEEVEINLAGFPD